MTASERSLLDVPFHTLRTLQRLHRGTKDDGRIDPAVYERERASFGDHLATLRRLNWIQIHPDGPVYLGSGPLKRPSLQPLTRSIVTTATGGDA
jgi:hypothetical protein